MVNIKKSIDEYIEFDSSKLFFDPLVRIFGGAIRDSINGDPINDVDILVGSKSISRINFILESEGYYRVPLFTKDLASVYTDIHVISEPHTWMKNKKIIQLIRPAMSHLIAPNGSKKAPNNSIVYKQMYENLISNVDISCCGVSYDGVNIYENYPDAIVSCLTKTFSVNSGAAMYSQKRISHRIAKFEERGWVNVGKGNDIRRDLIIDQLLGPNSLEYIPYKKDSNIFELDGIG